MRVANPQNKTHYPLPNEVSNAVRADINRPVNFGLLCHRFQSYPEEWGWKVKGKDEKRYAWERLVNASNTIFQSERVKQAAKALRHRQRETVIALQRGGLCVLDPPLTLKVAWRLAIGLSTPSVLEVGISLHHVYGIPYLPDSGIKGAVRHHRLSQIAEKLGVPTLRLQEIERRHKAKPRQSTPWEMLEELLLAEEKGESEKDKEASQEEINKLFNRLQQDKKVLDQPNGIKRISLEEFRTTYAQDFRLVFGSTEGKGGVIFMDAFPEMLTMKIKEGDPPEEKVKSILELDIINPHYQEFYTGDGKTPPADYLNPVPVNFLTVRAQTPFRFYLCAKDQTALDKAREWLQEAAQLSGLGAKTMVGYGEML